MSKPIIYTVAKHYNFKENKNVYNIKIGMLMQELVKKGGSKFKI